MKWVVTFWACCLLQLDLKMSGEEGETSTYVMNGEWALLGTSVDISRLFLPCCLHRRRLARWLTTFSTGRRRRSACSLDAACPVRDESAQFCTYILLDDRSPNYLLIASAVCSSDRPGHRASLALATALTAGSTRLIIRFNAP